MCELNAHVIVVRDDIHENENDTQSEAHCHRFLHNHSLGFVIYHENVNHEWVRANRNRFSITFRT
jgi:hypothetical protein